MTEYYCKCGKIMQKSTNAETTGNKLEDYSPAHSCYGCPYVLENKGTGIWNSKIKSWEYSGQITYECRMSKNIRYTSFVDGNLGTTDKTVAHIFTLDIPLIKEIQQYAEEKGYANLEVERGEVWKRSSNYYPDGRIKLSIYPAKNLKGAAEKTELLSKYFHPMYRDGETEDTEREKIYKYIQECKDMANTEKVEQNELDEANTAFPAEGPDPWDEDYVDPDGDPEEEAPEAITEQEDEPENDYESVSLTDSIFDSIWSSADKELQNLANELKSKYIESGEMVIKLILNNYGGELAFSPKSSITSQIKPQKVSSQIRLPGDLIFRVDSSGELVLPVDRQHQMTIDEVTPTMEITTDQSGVVTDIKDLDNRTEDKPELFKCPLIDCPFYTGFNGIENGCTFPGDDALPLNDENKANVYAAVTDCCCDRSEVIGAYKKYFPEEPHDVLADESEPDPVYENPELDDEISDERPYCENYICEFCDIIDSSCNFKTKENYTDDELEEMKSAAALEGCLRKDILKLMGGF